MTDLTNLTTFNVASSFDDVKSATEYPVLETGEYVGKMISSIYKFSKTGNLMIQVVYNIEDGDVSLNLSEWIVVGGNDKNGKPNLSGGLSKIKALLTALGVVDYFPQTGFKLGVFAEQDGLSKVMRKLSDIVPAGHKFYENLVVLKVVKQIRPDGSFSNSIKSVFELKTTEEDLNDNVPF